MPRLIPFLYRCLWIAASIAVLPTPGHAQSLIENPGMQADADGDHQPDGWPALSDGLSWQTEGGNRFLRLVSSKPGSTVMLYREIHFPAGTEALEITWRQRVSGLKPGAKGWFDARIMLGFMDASRAPLSPDPAAPYTRNDTNGWQDRSVTFAVPAGARILKFMPSLFQVEAGTYDLDDIAVKPVAASAVVASTPKPVTPSPGSQTKPPATLVPVTGGAIIPNGNMETPAADASWPAGWPKLEVGGSWVAEGANHFIRLTSSEANKMVLLYTRFPVPSGTKAFELGWKQRLTNFKKGAAIWHDARIMIEFLDGQGQKITGPNAQPSPPYTNQNTKGWEDKKTQFLVPANAAFVVLMPALFQVESGTLDLDDFSLQPTGTGELEAAAARAIAAEKFRYVPPEAPNPSKFPPPLHVSGNKLLTPDGKEVWLQGLSTSGMETLYQDNQCPKSLIVAVEEWKANIMRLPVNESYWFGRGSGQTDGGKAYRERVDFILTLAANRGAYLLIDLHRFRAPAAEHVEFWTDVATRYKNHPAAIFDLFNEPHGISWEVWRNGGIVGEKEKPGDEDAFLSQAELLKLNKAFKSVGMQTLVDTVRATGAKNLVLASGLFWSYDLTGIADGYALEDKTGNGIMYSWHVYNWHRGWESKVLAAAAKYPILVAEVGADVKKMSFIPLEAQESPFTWVPDMLGFIQKHRLNWTGWCFHPAATPVLISDWNYTPTPFWGVFAKQALAGKQFELKKTR